MSVWIGEIQWMLHNGISNSTHPILDPLETIEYRDAILAPDGGYPDWPEVDAVIGNPLPSRSVVNRLIVPAAVRSKRSGAVLGCRWWLRTPITSICVGRQVAQAGVCPFVSSANPGVYRSRRPVTR